jgi:hypothetical protein
MVMKGATTDAIDSNNPEAESGNVLSRSSD